MGAFSGGGCGGTSNVRARRNSGKIRAHNRVTTTAPMPPATTAVTGPISEALKPARASPSSLEAEMARVEAAPTRPRISSGV
jgi:hypothetical protein